MNVKMDPEIIIERLKEYKSKLEIMDRKYRDFLTDRENLRNPNPEELLEEIRGYESRVYTSLSADVQLWLDNLMNSVVVHEQYWRRITELDTEKRNEALEEAKRQEQEEE